MNAPDAVIMTRAPIPRAHAIKRTLEHRPIGLMASGALLFAAVATLAVALLHAH
jgi:hypothetical protein